MYFVTFYKCENRSPRIPHSSVGPGAVTNHSIFSVSVIVNKWILGSGLETTTACLHFFVRSHDYIFPVDFWLILYQPREPCPCLCMCTLIHENPPAGPAPQACVWLCSHLEPHPQKSPLLGSMFCCHYLEIRNNFWTRRLTFSFCTGSHKIYSQSCSLGSTGLCSEGQVSFFF